MTTPRVRAPKTVPVTRTVADTRTETRTRTEPETVAEERPTPERVQPLRVAEQLITRDRNNTYGAPTQDFDRTAAFWTVYLGMKLLPGAVIEMHDVALMIDLLKTSRLVWSPGQFDSWADKAGYVGCGWECVVAEEKAAAKREAAEKAAEKAAGKREAGK